jgi:hypothetical protein
MGCVSRLRFKHGPNLPKGNRTEDVAQLRYNRSEIFIEKILPLNSSSVRSGIDLRFAMSLPTELEESKGAVSNKHFAPSGAGGISSLPIHLLNLGAQYGCQAPHKSPGESLWRCRSVDVVR